MNLACLSKGGGFHFPPCHILSICGFLVLLDCPLDLSSLTLFSPIPTYSNDTLDEDSDCPDNLSVGSESVGQQRKKMETNTDANNLVRSEPWYKTVKNLHRCLRDVALIDVVLISSPMGMLGLPFLTRTKGFSAKIYATEAAARLGQLMMEDLVAVHMEARQFYGREESSPPWLKREEIEVLPSALKEIVLGEDGSDIDGWMPLYSAADLKDCMQKVQALKYGEETCYNGTSIFTAFSSGLEIGTCNWTINGPNRKIACLSSSIFVSSHAMNFDYQALQAYDLILYSDFSLLDSCLASTVNNLSAIRDESYTQDVITELLLNADENSEEMEKLAFISSCAVDSVKAGGSVLIPIGRLGIVLQLLENISSSLESLTLKVPIYMLSSVAEDLLAFSNIIPEWLCKQRQQKLYSGESLFAHVDLIKEKKLHLFPAVHSKKLLEIWQEPCVVFSSHWSLRLGPVVHFLRRWQGDKNSLLVMEEGLDTELALLPFQPMAMKILQCSFLSGIKLQKVEPLLKMLQPKYVVFPENLRQYFGFSTMTSTSFIPYSENETLCLPSMKLNSELDIATDLVSQLIWTKVKEDINVARLKGDLLVEHGKHRLVPRNEQAVSSQSKLLVHWGSVNLHSLVTELQKIGINASVEQGTSDTGSQYTVHVLEPNKALIEISATDTVISAAEEKLASLIFEAIEKSLDGV